MLAAGITDRDLWRRLPEDFAFYLRFGHAENSRRNEALRRQLSDAAPELNRIDVQPLLLKDAVRLADGLYPDLGWRFMQDLDVLVPRVSQEK